MLALNDSEILTFWPSKSRSKSQCTIFANNHLMANVKIYKRLQHVFSVYHFRDIKILNILPSKASSRLPSKIFTFAPFDTKCNNQQISPTHFCAISYCFINWTTIKVSSLTASHEAQTVPDLTVSLTEPLLTSLHWLPVMKHRQFQITTLTHRALMTGQLL